MKSVKWLNGALLGAMIVCASALRAADGGEILWWMVEDLSQVSAVKDGQTVTAAELGVNAARVRYETADASGYLPIYGVAEDKAYPATGTGAAALLPGEYFSSLGSFAGASYSFVLELGNWSDGAWVRTSMESAAASYDQLDRHLAEWHGMTPVYAQPWSPTSFSVVPEPTGGVLMLLGAALLALRRRKQVVAA